MSISKSIHKKYTIWGKRENYKEKKQRLSENKHQISFSTYDFNFKDL